MHFEHSYLSNIRAQKRLNTFECWGNTTFGLLQNTPLLGKEKTSFNEEKQIIAAFL